MTFKWMNPDIIKFPKGELHILRDEGERGVYGRGYEIQLDLFNREEDELEGVGCWSFGYEDWSRDIWNDWGDYILKRMLEIEGDQEALDDLLDELNGIDCHYWKDRDNPFEEEHLAELDVIKVLITELDKETLD
ncbi:hypothetical protein [Priestia endophytica]|uniref:Uncharacterized protein n=1 Tax=Priestia endophytica DSM 13796 TaxID=1121089 RepID=A0A1I6C078_9BACI|nr:hypothetical protein [Priestia endophytica]KYG33450.1 hypothetical protein AZF06_21640 [Priestia endophytica]SFQ86588.1 hypothetical protein SAMN02745910_04675 [Priestia endophytica DSM 13796]